MGAENRKKKPVLEVLGSGYQQTKAKTVDRRKNG